MKAAHYLHIPRLLVAALTILLTGAVHAPAGVITGLSSDLTGSTYTGPLNSIQFAPVGNPQAIGANVYWNQTAYAPIATNGAFAVQLQQGFYYASPLSGSIFGPVTRKILIYNPDGSTNTYSFAVCANLALVLGGYLQTNIPMAADSSLLTNANASTLFSSGVIPAQFLPPGGGSATNAVVTNSPSQTIYGSLTVATNITAVGTLSGNTVNAVIGSFSGGVVNTGAAGIVSASGAITNQFSGGPISSAGGFQTTAGGIYSGNASGLTALPGANVTGTVPTATSAGTATDAVWAQNATNAVWATNAYNAVLASNVVSGVQITNADLVGNTTGNGSGLTNVIPADYVGKTNIIYLDLTSSNAVAYYGNNLHPVNQFITALLYANTNPIANPLVAGAVAGAGYIAATIETVPGQTYIACAGSGQPIFVQTNAIVINNYGATLIGQTNNQGSGAFFTMGVRRIASQGGTNAATLTINGGIVENITNVDAHIFTLANSGIFTNYLTLSDVRLNNYNLALAETANFPPLYYELNFNNTVWHVGGDCFYLFSNPALTNEFDHCFFSGSEQFTNTGFDSQNNLPVGNYIGTGYYNFNDCQFVQTLFSGADMTVSNGTVNLVGCTFVSQCATNIYAQGGATVNIWGGVPPNTVFQDGTCTINFYNASNVLVLGNLNVNSNLTVTGNSSLQGTNNLTTAIVTNVLYPVQFMPGSGLVNGAWFYQTCLTNTSFTFSGIENLTSGYYNIPTILVTNSSGALITITAQPQWINVAGSTWNCTNESIVDVWCVPGQYTNAFCRPLF